MLKQLLAEAALVEANSGSLWHSTSLKAALLILTTGKLQLTFSGGTHSDNVHGAKHFYLSTSRSPNGGYNLNDYAGNINVMLELDWRHLSQRYEVVPVAYWGDMGRGDTRKRSELRRFDENEERIWSDKPQISIAGAIRGVHVYIPPRDVGEHETFRLSQLVKLADVTRLHFYKDLAAYKLVDARREVDPPNISIAEPQAYQYSRDKQIADIAGKIDWLEDPLNPDKHGRRFDYFDFFQVLESDLHNLRSEKTEEAQEQLHRVSKLLRKRRMASVKELVLHAQKVSHEAYRASRGT